VLGSGGLPKDGRPGGNPVLHEKLSKYYKRALGEYRDGKKCLRPIDSRRPGPPVPEAVPADNAPFHRPESRLVVDASRLPPREGEEDSCQGGCHPVVISYAILLGYLCGLRGKLLLDSPWTRLLDSSCVEKARTGTHPDKYRPLHLYRPENWS